MGKPSCDILAIYCDPINCSWCWLFPPFINLQTSAYHHKPILKSNDKYWQRYSPVSISLLRVYCTDLTTSIGNEGYMVRKPKDMKSKKSSPIPGHACSLPSNVEPPVQQPWVVEATPQVQSSLALLPSQHMQQQSWATTQKNIYQENHLRWCWFKPLGLRSF